MEFTFDNTPAGLWLIENAYKYSWVMSFPKNSEDVTGYAYEPWHYRYIGKDYSLQMKELGLNLKQFLDKK